MSCFELVTYFLGRSECTRTRYTSVCFNPLTLVAELCFGSYISALQTSQVTSREKKQGIRCEMILCDMRFQNYIYKIKV